jgi:hypothetical protein
MVRDFFSTLTFGETKRIQTDNKYFKNRLYDFLEGRGDAAERQKARILDKLFTRIPPEYREITKPGDLREGETAELEIDSERKKERHLAAVVEVMANELAFHVAGWNPPAGTEGRDVKVYVYRPGEGGFVLEGKAGRTGKNSLFYQHTGRIRNLEDYHLMALKKLPVKFISWPVVKEEGEGLEESAEKHIENIVIHGTTEKISDRAFLFQFKDEDDRAKYHGNKTRIWQIHLNLPVEEEKEHEFTCRGRILAKEATREEKKVFLFKYIDCTQDDRKALYDFIKNNSPVREKL